MASSSFRIFLFSFFFIRLPTAYFSSAFFQPDEYWQSLEVAHKLVFGYGYTTWEWRGNGIRSPLYPLLFTPVYWTLKVTGLDETRLLILAPRVLQAAIAAWTDTSTYVLAKRLYGPTTPIASASLFLSLSSFFNIYASTRTFSNSTETALTIAALSLWPWDGLSESEAKKDRKTLKALSSESLTKALCLAATATILRPSNAVIWLILGLHLLYSTSSTSIRLSILSRVVVIGLITSLLCFILDSLYYSTPTFTPYTFLVQNVIHSISLFYGANPFHFYLTQAIPFMLLTQLPFVVHGLLTKSANKRVWLMKVVVGGTIGVYSLLGHKEFRFIMPLLPLLHIFGGSSLLSLSRPSSSIKTSFILLVLVSTLPGLYMTTLHASGVTSVMTYLRETLPMNEKTSVGFLMPCHSTPWQSHLHRKDLEVSKGGSGEGGRVWFLTCEPPILGQDPSTYLDQSDIFYASPSAYLSTYFPSSVNPLFPPSPFDGLSHTWPTHLVLFSNLLEEDKVGEILRDKGYEERKRIWNSHWHEDERRRGEVVVLEWKG